jgi:PAS domain S-box-containing protein
MSGTGSEPDTRPAPLPAEPGTPAARRAGWAVITLSGDGRVLAADERLSALCGWRPEAVLGRPMELLLTPAARLIAQSVLWPLLRLDGHVAEFVLTLRHADGSDLDVMLATEPARDGAGLTTLLTAITQRRRIEAELLRVKRAADQAPGMVFELRHDGAGHWWLPFASDACRALFACTPEVLARDAGALFADMPPDDAQALRSHWTDLLARRRGGTLRTRVRRGDAQRVLEWHSEPRPGAQGLALWHGHVHDVSERIELESARADHDAALRLAELRAEFLGRASHELRTPLNGILGFTQLLRHDPDLASRPVALDRLGIIERSGRHLLALVDELLQVARLQREAPAPDLRPLALAPLVDECLELLAVPAQQAGVTLVPPRLPPGLQALAEPQALRQLLLNLLGNAVKYNRRGGEVRVQAEVDGAGVCLTVSDQGPGLQPQQLAHLFEPFNRLGAERSQVPGAGLGLVICRELAQRMGAEMLVESCPGEGSRFGVRLAAAPADPPPEA